MKLGEGTPDRCCSNACWIWKELSWCRILSSWPRFAVTPLVGTWKCIELKWLKSWWLINNTLYCEVNWLFNVTINDISVTYVTAHRCAGWLKKKLDLRSASQHHRHFVVVFFNVPVYKQRHGTNLFIRWFRHYITKRNNILDANLIRVGFGAKDPTFLWYGRHTCQELINVTIN